MGILVRLLVACVAALLLAGCGVVREERNNRGGYTDHLADTYWMKADSKPLRVLRAYALQAALARLAVISPRGAKDRSVVALRMQQANMSYAAARTCAEALDPINGTPRGCIYFDDAMLAWSDDLFALAMASLSIEDGESFLSKVTSGGVDALQALFELGRTAFAMGRAVGAIYRDTIELEVVVWLDDRLLAERVGTLRSVYANGAGSLESWKAELAALKAASASLPANQAYPLPQPEHFAEMTAFIDKSCMALTADPAIQAICKSPRPPASQPLAERTPAPAALRLFSLKSHTDQRPPQTSAASFTNSVLAVSESFQ